MICSHLDQSTPDVKPSTENGCEECIKSGDTWVHLRMCLTCGHVGCCNSSKNQHAKKHFDQTSHAVMKSLQPEENWKWCYIDQAYID